MKSFAVHENAPLHVNVKSFNILRAITDTNFFSRVDLSPTARLVIFSLANMYNPKKGFVYPKNSKLMKCTGSGERAVSQAVGELKDKGVIVIVFEENFRKIYFTQKTYELLKIVDCEKEVGEEAISLQENSEDGRSRQNEFNLNGADVVAFREEKIAGAVAKNEGGVAKNEGTCHEQKKEQIRKHFVNSKSDFRFDEERGEIKKAFRDGGYLTNKMQAGIIMDGFHRHNVKNDSDFKAIFRIKKVWNFEEDKFEILRFIREKRKADMIFARKIEKIENDVEFSLVGYEKDIEELRACWKDFA